VKNFPHQINRLERFAGGLGVFGDLVHGGADLTDDGAVGDALARAGVYTFRETYDPANVDQLLEEEHAKPASSRGTRTMARELRRTFLQLGLVNDSDAGFELSRAAGRLTQLDHEPLAPEAGAIWSAAFRTLEVVDESGSSHPYELMIRLAGERPGIENALLGLALEARDDSDREFARVLELVDGHSANSAWERLGVSPFQRQNSVKILPAVARQLGELEVADGRAYVALPDPSAPREEHGRRERRTVRSRRRRYDRTRSRGLRPVSRELTLRSYDPDLLAARYAAHEECLSAFDELFPSDLARWEGDYDLLVLATLHALLVEVKTLRSDASHQTRLALGQLLYYDHFDVHPEWPDWALHRVLVVDRELDPDLLAFLDSHSVGALWLRPQGGWAGSDRGVEQVARFGVEL